MKIIVLGNGFDLASGLDTTYSSYLNYQEIICAEEISIIKDILSKTARSRVDENSPASEVLDNRHIEMKSLFDEIDKQIVQLSKQKKISTWDLFFMKNRLLNDEQDLVNWSDVEKTIKLVITNEENFGLILTTKPVSTYGSYIKDYIDKLVVFNTDPSKVYSSDNYKKNILLGFSKKDRLMYIIDRILLERYSKFDFFDFNDYLYKELNSFERNFRQFITDKIEGFELNKESNNSKLYIKNMLKLDTEKNNANQAYYLLNFNYTRLYEGYFTEVLMKNKQFENISVTQNNVHGTYDDYIVFGVDQENANFEESIYTKTMRKIYNSANVESGSGLPSSDTDTKIREIIIYGHSLSDADYSYFQTLFDYYNILDSDIKLIFAYTEYHVSDSGNNDEENELVEVKNEKIRRDFSVNVMRLLKEYGSKFEDSSKGENLVHRLILESRLSIRNILPEKINKLEVPNEKISEYEKKFGKQLLKF